MEREKEPNSSLHLIHFFRSYFVLFIHFIRASIPLTLFLSLQWSEMKWSEMEWKEEEKSGMKRTRTHFTSFRSLVSFHYTPFSSHLSFRDKCNVMNERLALCLFRLISMEWSGMRNEWKRELSEMNTNQRLIPPTQPTNASFISCCKRAKLIIKQSVHSVRSSLTLTFVYN